MNCENDTLTFILFSIVTIFIVYQLNLKCRDSFTSWEQKTKKIGYPSIQGALSNYHWGLDRETKQKMLGQWNGVLSPQREFFKAPRPRTVLK